MATPAFLPETSDTRLDLPRPVTLVRAVTPVVCTNAEAAAATHRLPRSSDRGRELPLALVLESEASDERSLENVFRGWTVRWLSKDVIVRAVAELVMSG